MNVIIKEEERMRRAREISLREISFNQLTLFSTKLFFQLLYNLYSYELYREFLFRFSLRYNKIHIQHHSSCNSAKADVAQEDLVQGGRAGSARRYKLTNSIYISLFSFLELKCLQFC